MLVVSPAGIVTLPRTGMSGSGYRPPPARASTPVLGLVSCTYPTRNTSTAEAGMVPGPVRSVTTGVIVMAWSLRIAICAPSYSSRAAAMETTASAVAGFAVSGKTLSEAVAGQVSTAAPAVSGTAAVAASATQSSRAILLRPMCILAWACAGEAPRIGGAAHSVSTLGRNRSTHDLAIRPAGATLTPPGPDPVSTELEGVGQRAADPVDRVTNRDNKVAAETSPKLALAA